MVDVTERKRAFYASELSEMSRCAGRTAIYERQTHDIDLVAACFLEGSFVVTLQPTRLFRTTATE